MKNLFFISTLIVILIVSSVVYADAGDKKYIIIGIDGMDYSLLSEMMEKGEMPNFDKLRRKGGFKPLLSSIPPQSPVAWSNFITGMDPGGHLISFTEHPKIYSLIFQQQKPSLLQRCFPSVNTVSL